jgi:hypothetical protein
MVHRYRPGFNNGDAVHAAALKDLADQFLHIGCTFTLSYEQVSRGCDCDFHEDADNVDGSSFRRGAKHDHLVVSVLSILLVGRGQNLLWIVDTEGIIDKFPGSTRGAIIP